MISADVICKFPALTSRQTFEKFSKIGIMRLKLVSTGTSPAVVRSVSGDFKAASAMDFASGELIELSGWKDLLGSAKPPPRELETWKLVGAHVSLVRITSQTIFEAAITPTILSILEQRSAGAEGTY